MFPIPDFEFTNALLKKWNLESERVVMHKSKLELYEDILVALDNKILTIDALAYSCNMDCLILRNRLDFLLKNDVVEEKTTNKKAFCVSGSLKDRTRRGKHNLNSNSKCQNFKNRN